jgi:hypothetical protein
MHHYKGGEMADREEQTKKPADDPASDRQSAREEQPRAIEEDHSLKVHGDKLEKLIPKGPEN